MATASPVIINSSSPEVFGVPSITPPSALRRASKPNSSSPGLPSPSAFVRPQASGLKSGSRLQQPPDGAKSGFASAASLWKLNRFELESKELEGGVDTPAVQSKTKESGNEPEKRSEIKAKKSSGKLVKSKKVSKATETENLGDITSRSPQLKDFAFQDNGFAKELNGETGFRQDIYDVPIECHIRKPSPRRSPSLGLSKYALEPSVIDGVPAAEGPDETSKPAKKPRKKAAKSTEKAAGSTTKKSRKRIAKSASIILNSDEPDAANDVHDSFTLQQQALKDHSEAQKLCKPARRKAKTPKFSAEEAVAPQTIERVAVPESTDHDASKQCSGATLIEKSAYFAKSDNAAASNAVQSADMAPTVSVPLPIEGECAAERVDAQPLASRRRLSWTPVKDSETITLPDTRPTTAGSPTSQASQIPNLDLKDILGGFGYVSNNADKSAAERTPSGEAVTKRRRIELANDTAAGNSVRKVSDSLPNQRPEKPTKPKKPKKKPQTITALATAAFHDPEPPEQNRVSAFFAPRTNQDLESQTEEPPAIIKSKKPRKPRTKPSAEANTDSATKRKKPAKPRKAKVKFDEKEYLPKLYSPARASAQLHNQDLLFGTSSQIAIDESANVLRDIQKAIHDSQLPQASQVGASPKWKSYVRVPTAPHGTCLSVEQADREMWCVAARDFKGGVMRDMQIKKGAAAARKAPPHAPDQAIYAPCPDDVALKSQDNNNRCETPSAEVELVNEPPRATFLEATKARPHEAQECVHEGVQYLEPDPAPEVEDDSWMLLRSDESEPLQQQSLIGPQSPRDNGFLSPSIATIPSPCRPKSLSPLRALRPLDANANILPNLHYGKGVQLSPTRALSTTTANSARKPPSPSKRPRGRPRKEDSLAVVPPVSPRRRGRPPKKSALASDAPRPAPATKAAKIGGSASQPVQTTEWADIDEIYDSDPPNTPSPPRRRAHSTPPAIQPLQLSPIPSPSTELKASAIAASVSVKVGDSQWPEMRSTLFPQITHTVKSAPRSDNPTNPSWWEKILLYDPIVLEDFTAWLNGQGLRVHVRRQKAKVKKRGRKKKEDVEANAEDGPECEFSEEPLQHWMVQKWCQEKSVCCLWKEGLRGGVRNRY